MGLDAEPHPRSPLNAQTLSINRRRIFITRHGINIQIRQNDVCNALILSGGPVLDICPLPGHMPPITHPRQGRRTRQLFSRRGGCARGQMSCGESSEQGQRASCGSSAAEAKRQDQIAVSLHPAPCPDCSRHPALTAPGTLP